jgi:hypothetical protein
MHHHHHHDLPPGRGLTCSPARTACTAFTAPPARPAPLARWPARLMVMAGLVGLGGLGATAPARAIEGGSPTNNFASVGNGVQVTADWVFTAAHAVLNPGDTFANGFGNRTVAARFLAPGATGFPANDFALMRLVPFATAAPLLPVLGSAIPAGPFGPLEVTITSGANHPPALGSGFTQVSESVLTDDPDGAGPDPAVTVNWLLSLDTVVHVEGGDSGGGLFFGHVTDSSTLLGINSALLEDAQKNPLGSAFVQPAAYRSWIDDVMSQNSGGQVVWWVSAVPEPATWALWPMGGGVLALVARRRRASRFTRA